MSFEQAVVQLEQTNSKLQEEVVRFRDAAMGLNAIYSTITEGRQNTADGGYFSVPGGGTYMRLYRRQGSSAELIAEFPDRAELNSVLDQLGPLLGRGVSAGLNNLGTAGVDLVRLADAPFASRAYYGNYHSGQSANQNIDQALPGECALYSTANMGVFPENSGSFIWVETQRLYNGNALVQKAVNYANTASSGWATNVRSWKRLCSNSLTPEGERNWGQWVEDISSQNIVGNVERASVIESGSNDDGSYVKLTDGTMFCHLRPVFSYGSGSWQTFATPLSFEGRYGISWSFNQTRPEYFTKWKAVAFGHYSANSIRGIFRTEGTTLEHEDLNEYVDVTIFGRWKA